MSGCFLEKKVIKIKISAERELCRITLWYRK
jgi:hypothetical protein